MNVNAIKACPMDQELLDRCLHRIYIECEPLSLGDCDLLLRHWQAMIVNDANLRMQNAKLKAQNKSIRHCSVRKDDL